MSSVAARKRYTPEEYLALERKAEFKSEYYRGEIFAMAGTSWEHSQVMTNLIGTLRSGLADGPCQAVGPEMRVYIPSTGLYTYPDVVVVCGDPNFQDDQFDTLLNPTILFEVLSPSTEAYDRGQKFRHYRGVESLREYVLVAQDRPSIERYSKGDNPWTFQAWESLDGALVLDSIGLQIPLAEVYARVKFSTLAEGGPENRPGR